MSYKNLAIDAISKMMGFDPFLPKSEAMVLAYAEALEHARINDRDDVLMAVRVMYVKHGDPGWRPTPKVLIDTARECGKIRREREADDAERRAELEGPPRRTFREFREAHPDVVFPKFGKDVPSE